ncbi:thioredoxin-like protein [Choanephora cucurbitarum]|nr:thioredoxin-like protein [Choanephora cucurbitarum]
MDDPNADTEWNDILRAKGILPPKDEKKDDELEDAFVEMVQARQAKLDSLENKDLDELDELEDLEDDQILNQYRHKRMMEMQAQAAKEKYGEITEISKPDFVREVTEASKECYVVVHLYKDAIPASRLMHRCLSELALQFKATKFVRIVSDQCIPNYPDFNVPTLLIYGEGDIKANLAGAIQFGGMKMTTRSLRSILAKYGAVPAEKSENDDESNNQPKKSIYQSKNTAALSSDEESDDDDRGYY